MTKEQRRLVNDLIKKSCANYRCGNCVLLDDGEECVCVQSISISLCCNYFRNAVLPLDKKLEKDILSSITKYCEECHKPFSISSERSRQRYCTDCAKKRIRKSKNANKSNGHQGGKVRPKKPTV